MKRTYYLIFSLLIATGLYGQTKNFIDQPYLEISATVDTLVVPDRIYLNIFLSEKDTKDRTSVEELENRMEAVLQSLGINTKEQLQLADFGSNYKDYFLRKTGVIKSKAFTLIVYDALTAGKVIQGLESQDIANTRFSKVELSTMENLKLQLMSDAVAKAKFTAEKLLQPLGQQLGKALHITENTPFYAMRSQATMSKMDLAEEAAPIDVDFKKIRVSSTVNVKFAIQ